MNSAERAHGEVDVEVDVEATMRDGTVLRADVYRPAGGGPWPTLLVRTPYDKRDPGILDVLDPPGAARAGFAVAVQDVRGRYASGGEWVPLLHEREDGYDSVRWAARLPGADGRVGMYGPSYLGYTQWAAMAAAPPELVAAVPAFTWSDPSDGLTARGGAEELGLIGQWTLGLGYDVLRRRGVDAGELTEALNSDRFWDPSVVDRLRLPRPVPPTQAGRGGVPALIVAGWYDSFLQGSLDNYRSDTDALIVGPWSHNNQSGRVGEVDFGDHAAAGAIGVRGIALDWLRRPGPPSVLVFVMGTGRWHTLPGWPPPSTPTVWYLRSGGELTEAPPPAGEPATELRYDAADPVPALGGPLLMTAGYPAGPIDQALVERRPDVLTYTGAPLDRPIEVIGRVTATIVASSGVAPADWVVRLCDVDSDGVSRNVTDGMLRIREPTGSTRRRSGEHTVDLWSTAHTFLAGHRIRVQVTSSCFPRWSLNPDSSGTLRTVHAGSRILLPVTR
ncbi:CocE/NonD family hydrolase [Rugosimonospora africana]|uniref:X-Pro dipeptidyl-peptidase n=1 Tax=Rugosimonospora africana TaxID=556532 RepID=A0A8J3QSK8_9ACTN|nr:CocE/NonD family hydrolase [Rugosimonospora africana]GIH15691.1 X-Pro dipeptidyl-peptidase [Rugosimonospora africana]